MSRTRILLAEDDIDDYRFFVEAFEAVSNSYIISRAKNGLECINSLKTGEKPHLIFLDLNMPIKNGLECLHYIKDTEQLAHIPVMIYSTSHYIKHIDAAFKGGAHYYIVKPSNTTILVDILKTLIKRLEEDRKAPTKEDFVLRNVLALDQ